MTGTILEEAGSLLRLAGKGLDPLLSTLVHFQPWAGNYPSGYSCLLLYSKYYRFIVPRIASFFLLRVVLVAVGNLVAN